jgi:hypothetical protein
MLGDGGLPVTRSVFTPPPTRTAPPGQPAPAVARVPALTGPSTEAETTRNGELTGAAFFGVPFSVPDPEFEELVQPQRSEEEIRRGSRTRPAPTVCRLFMFSPASLLGCRSI